MNEEIGREIIDFENTQKHPHTAIITFRNVSKSELKSIKIDFSSVNMISNDFRITEKLDLLWGDGGMYFVT